MIIYLLTLININNEITSLPIKKMPESIFLIFQPVKIIKRWYKLILSPKTNNSSDDSPIYQ